MKDEINSRILETMFRFFKTVKPTMSFHSKTSDLTMVQFEALILIKHNPDIQMKDLAEHFSITMPSATSLIDKLIEMKYAGRKNDIKDRRIVKIHLTKQGEKLLHEAMKQRETKINRLLSSLSKNDKEDLLRILETVVEKTEAYEK
jgi:MarR family transcriptional regulator, organic hydroperoxide resistance regulator